MAKAGIKREIGKFRKILDQFGVEVDQLLLFGSHARGLASKLSDIDLCVVCKDNSADTKALQMKLNGAAGLAGLNMDIIVTTSEQYRKNRVSPILHEIRTAGREV